MLPTAGSDERKFSLMGWSRRSRPAGVLSRRSVFFLCAVAAIFLPRLAYAADAQGEKIELSVQPVRWNPQDRGDLDAGELEWAGEIEIESSRKRFGGWSGIAVNADGSALLAISDEAQWLTAQLLYDEKGRLSGMGNARIAPMLDFDGNPLKGKQLADAEGLAVDGADPLRSNAYVSFERQHRIWRYDLGTDGFAARPDQLLTQRRLGRLNSNSAIEAIALMAPAEGKEPPRLLLVTENTRDPRGNLRAFIAEGRKVSRLSFRLHDSYRPTDVARLPDGDFLLLERRFSLLAGAGMKISRIRAADIKPDAIVDGEVLLDVGQRRSIDNMEGISVRRDRTGNIWIYVISDNNISELQRTLLVMFRLKSEAVTPRHTPRPAGSRDGASGSAPIAPAPKPAE